MRNWMKIALVAIAAVALVTVVFACEAEKSADKTAGKSGCSHAAKTETASMKADGAAGCTHAKTEAAAMKADGAAGCTHAKGAKAEVAGYKDTAAGCPFHSKATEAQRAALVKGEKVTLVGQVVCASCDLKQAKECKSVFKTDGGDLYAIVGNDAFEKLSTQTMHGEKKVEVVGTTAKDSGESIVLLESYKLL